MAWGVVGEAAGGFNEVRFEPCVVDWLLVVLLWLLTVKENWTLLKLMFSKKTTIIWQNLPFTLTIFFEHFLTFYVYSLYKIPMVLRGNFLYYKFQRKYHSVFFTILVWNWLSLEKMIQKSKHSYCFQKYFAGYNLGWTDNHFG